MSDSKRIKIKNSVSILLAQTLEESIEILLNAYVDKLPDQQIFNLSYEAVAKFGERRNVARYPTPKRGWCCFHCGQVFITQDAAALHFGTNNEYEPGCLMQVQDQGLLGRIRDLEKELIRYQSEDSDADRRYHKQQSDHRIALQHEEEKGYARGLEDARKEIIMTYIDLHDGNPQFIVKFMEPPTSTGRTHQFRKGWYIVATCDCHNGTVVSRQYETEEEANSSLKVLINA